ncbi:zinc-ribbon domain-containing protein [Chloroflexota bacterium]
MPYCHNCGNKVTDEMHFCPQCGHKLITPPGWTHGYCRDQTI